MHMEKAPDQDAAPARVLLYHGTSEGHVGAILRGGFLSPAQLALDSVRSVIADHLPQQDIGDDMVREVMRKGSRLQSRSDESNGGNTLFATPDAALAMDYAAQNAAHGGEFGFGVHQALVAMGHRDLPPRFDGARPVLLTLSIPTADIHLEKGMTVTGGAGALGSVQTHHEVFVNNTAHVEVLSVRFARPQGNGWTFDGQPDLTPAAALAEMSPAFANTAPRKGADDPLVQHIADTVYGFRNLPDVAIEHVRRKPVATAMIYGEDGSLQKIYVPDPDFEPVAQKLADGGFSGVAQSYKLPGALSPRELDGYLNALSAGQLHGHVSPEDKAAAEAKLFDRIMSDNPDAAPLRLAAKTPEDVSKALRGISQGQTVQDITFAIENPAAGRDAAYLAQKKSAGFALEWNPAPATIENIRVQLEQKIQRFNAAPSAPHHAV